MRILLIEDDRHYREFVQELLSANGYDVILADDGIVALDMLQEQAVDFILADVAMPRMNGYQLLACVSQNPLWAHIPFVFLSGRDLDSDIRYAEEMGIDGYLSKTAPVEDILAIVRGKLRRAQRYQQSQDIASVADGGQALQVGRLSVDLQKRRVWLDEQPIHLSAREFQLLAHLAQHANQVVPLSQLLAVTHGLETDFVDAGTLLRPLIRSLRRKMGYESGEMGCIENVRGVGYCLIPPA